MKSLKFIHCADLHIDSPFKGIGNINPELQNILCNSTFEAFNKIITIALENKVDFVLIAGDIYDSENKSLQAQFRFREGLTRLLEHGIPSYIVYGNHDPLDSWSATLKEIDGVNVFGDEVECKYFKKNGDILAKIYGVSFASSDIRDNLALKFPEVDGDIPCIGLLHANVGGRLDDAYSPCTVEDLSSKRMDYWALGHVHGYEIIKKANPAIVYPGCSQSRNATETGEKGCCLVTLSPGIDPDIQFINTDFVRYAQNHLDISDCSKIDEVVESVFARCQDISTSFHGCHAIIRLYLNGRTNLHNDLEKEGSIQDVTDKIRKTMEKSKPIIWLEKISLNTAKPYDVDALRQGKDFNSDVISICDELLITETPLRDELNTRLNALFTNRQIGRYLEKMSSEEMNGLLTEARDQILGELVETD
jgi:DNA repair protein SbcD/Mre11